MPECAVREKPYIHIYIMRSMLCLQAALYTRDGDARAVQPRLNASIPVCMITTPMYCAVYVLGCL